MELVVVSSWNIQVPFPNIVWMEELYQPDVRKRLEADAAGAGALELLDPLLEQPGHAGAGLLLLHHPLRGQDGDWDMRRG